MAFPVMTLAFDVDPVVAKDFSLMIQSCGMVCAAFSIIFMKVKLEWHAVLHCSLGGIIGTILGLEVIDPILTPAMKKMGFVSVWFSFAFSLFLLNLYHKRKTYHTIPEFGLGKTLILMATGIIGGIFTSVAGSGLDICTFSMLTLLFRISEKVATPTSVALMAANTLVGTYWRAVMMRDISQEAFDFLAVCVPVVVVGAPLGSVIGSHFHRHILASFVYISDTIALISAFCLVKQNKKLLIMSFSIIITGFVFFVFITSIGERLMKKVEKRRVESLEANTQQLDERVDIIETRPHESHMQPWLVKISQAIDI